MARENIIGLDIGRKSIKLVLLKQTMKGWLLSKYGTIPTPPGSIKEGMIDNVSLVTEAVRELFNSLKIKEKMVVLSALEKGSTNRLLKCPPMPPAEMREIVKADIGKLSLYKPEETLYDFCVLEELKEEELRKISVFTAVTQRKNIESLVQLAQNLDLTIMAIEWKVFAALRGLTKSNFNIPPQQFACLVMLGEETTEVNIFRGKVLQFNRRIELGRQAIAGAGGEIEETAPLLELVNELRRSIGFYQVQIPEEFKLGKIVLVSEEGDLPGLAQYITQRLAIPTEFVHPLAEIDTGNVPQELLEKSGTSLAICSGLAMRQKKEPRAINLLLISQEKRIPLTLRQQLTYFLVPGLSLLILLLIWSSFYDQRIKKIKEGLIPLEDKLKEVEPMMARIGEEKIRQMKTEQEWEKLIATLKGDNISLSPALREFKRLIPAEVWIEKITSLGNSISVEGKALSQTEVIKFSLALTDSPYFSGVNLKETGEVEEKERMFIKFNLSIQMKKGIK